MLELNALLLEKSDLVDVVLLKFPKVFLDVVDIFQDFFKDVIQTFCALVFKGGTLGPEQLRVFLAVVELLDAFFDVDLNA